MVKTYLRYSLKETIGQIAGGACPMVVLPSNRNELITACNNFILCFSIKTGELLYKLSNQKVKITCLATSGNILSVGYENGSVALVDLQSRKFGICFFNHKSAITSMAFNGEGSQLLSGSNDTTILLYDLLGEVPLFKYTGHKDNIIKVDYCPLNEEIVLSLGKDNALKLWDVKTQMSIFTHVDIVHKMTQFIAVNRLLLIGSYDDKIRIFRFNDEIIEKDNVTSIETKKFLTAMGVLNKQSQGKVISFFHSRGEADSGASILSILSNDNSVEFFKVLSAREVKNRMIHVLQSKDRDLKRDKLIKKEKYKEASSKVKELLASKAYNGKVHFKSLFKLDETSSKLKQKQLYVFIQSQSKFGILSNRNMIDLYHFSTEMLTSNIYQLHSHEIEELLPEDDQLVVKKDFSLVSMGHREVVRYVRYSTDSHLLVTISNDSVKLWSTDSFNVLKSLATIKNGTCFTFIHKAYGVIATRQGELFFVDVQSFSIIHHEAKGHEDAIWNSIAYKMSKDKSRLITCSSDKVIKHWTVSFNDTGLSLALYSEMTLIDSVTYCLLTSDKKYLAYSLMDNSIKVVFEDTQKLFLTLYGHKMPVTCFDISSDDLLLVSGSGDKNLKIWGMDFGDCHKSFFAHKDMITCVKFIPMTHFFLSTSKDGTLKYFDGDVFDLIMEFNDDAFDCIWWVDVNKEGTQLTTVSSDSAIRVYEITEEQIVPSFAQEEKLEKVISDEAEKEINQKDAVANPLNKDIDAIVPIKKRMDNIGYAEALMDSVLLCDKFKEEVYQYEIAQEEYDKAISVVNSKKKKAIETLKVYNLEKPEQPKPSLLLLNKNIFDYMLCQLKSIRSTELESTLNNVPYSYFQALLYYFEYFIRKNIEIELMGRCVIFFSFLFQSQISNDKTILSQLESIQKHLKSQMKTSFDLTSFNSKSIALILRSNTIKEKAINEFNSSFNKTTF